LGALVKTHFRPGTGGKFVGVETGSSFGQHTPVKEGGKTTPRPCYAGTATWYNPEGTKKRQRWTLPRKKKPPAGDASGTRVKKTEGEPVSAKQWEAWQR